MLLSELLATSKQLRVTTMAFDRMKALETYLQSCKDLPNFTEILEQQALMLVKEIRNLGKLDLQEGAPLLALVQQNTLWTKDLKETIAKSIQHKVQESMQKQGTVTTRCQLQNFTYFPIYLTQEDWDCVLNPSKPVAVKIHTVLERLFRLGLKAPSEDTQAMLTVCMLLTDQSRLFDNLQLRSAYLAVKQLVKQFLKARKDSDSGDFFPDLPACSKAIEDERRGNGYGDGEQPADLPSGITMEFLFQWMSVVPQRSNSSSIAISVPKSIPPGRFQPQHGTFGHPYVTQPMDSYFVGQPIAPHPAMLGYHGGCVPGAHQLAFHSRQT